MEEHLQKVLAKQLVRQLLFSEKLMNVGEVALAAGLEAEVEAEAAEALAGEVAEAGAEALECQDNMARDEVCKQSYSYLFFIVDWTWHLSLNC